MLTEVKCQNNIFDSASSNTGNTMNKLITHFCGGGPACPVFFSTKAVEFTEVCVNRRNHNMDINKKILEIGPKQCVSIISCVT